MNENLPMKRNESIFGKIKIWFIRLFKKEKTVEEAIKEIDTSVEQIKSNNFKEDIKVESKDKILALQRKLKEKQIEISELTDEELDEMIELYKKQIEEKKNKLKQYRNKISSKK